MPSQNVASKSLLDPVNLLVISAALAITFLPLTAAMLVNKLNESSAAAAVSNAKPPTAPAASEIKLVASR